MNSSVVIGALNRLLAVHCQSVAMYVINTNPWVPRGEDQAQAVFGDLVADRRELIQRLATYIDRLGGMPDCGQRHDYTVLNDLSLDFLLGRVISDQKETIHTIEQGLADFDSDMEAKALAQEALGMAKGHLESLEEVVQNSTGP